MEVIAERLMNSGRSCGYTSGCFVMDIIVGPIKDRNIIAFENCDLHLKYSS